MDQLLFYKHTRKKARTTIYIFAQNKLGTTKSVKHRLPDNSLTLF